MIRANVVWKLEEGQFAELPEEDRWQAPEQGCLE